jgi:carboxyl-terminal processing protease
MMHLRVLSLVRGATITLVAAALSLSTLLPASAQSQVHIPTAAISAPSETGALLQQGQELEEASRWLEALSHYDAALRQYPHDDALQLRRTLARIHCDLDRRLADSSFFQLCASIPETQALRLYHEIGLKVESHYVQEPDWQRLSWRGTANLDVALTKTAFASRYLQGVSPESINAFRHVLRDDVNQRMVRNRSEAHDLAAYTARLAAQRLGIPPTATIAEYCCGAIAALDQYSSYLTQSQLDDVYNQIEGNFVGLGIELKAEEDALLIVKVIPGGPADRGGVIAGDRIVAVDHQSTVSLSSDKAADLLKGPEGSEVTIAVRSPDNRQRDLVILRERVEVPCVEGVKIVDHQYGIGYLRLTSFQKTTSRDVDAALWELHRQGMRSLIVDVRGNPGGLLTASVEVADKFLPEGTIVSTRGRSPREDYDYTAHRVGTWRVPLVVLIDSDTASASEIFAGAIRDHGRGTVVGERSYGKGSVQGIFPLSISRSGVRLTTAKFFSPHGHPISHHGVQPHRVVQAAAKPDLDATNADVLGDGAQDPVLQAAEETARQLVLANRAG